MLEMIEPQWLPSPVGENCGLAGYNVSREFQKEYIDDAMMGRLLQEAWLHNLHRGTDAAGYFAVDADDKLQTYKKKGDAASTLTKMKRFPRASRVFGAHTRAGTKGSSDNAINNHPVHFQGIWVTHNGGVRNDALIKNAAEMPASFNMPEVDSVAIPIALTKAKDPRDIKEIAHALKIIEGGMAIHAVWKDHPGLSIIAKGVGSSLVTAVGEDSFFYGSEFASVWHMLHYLGLDPNDDRRWEFRTMDQDTIFIVENGVPIGWGSIPFITQQGSGWHLQKAKYDVSRMLPAEDGREAIEVYTTDLKSDFAIRVGNQGRDMTTAPEGRFLLIYTRADGFIGENNKEKFPRTTDSSLPSVMSEADAVYKDSVADTFHHFFGQVEIITNSTRSVLDVYNHALFATDDRWTYHDKVLPKLTAAWPNITNADLEIDKFMVRKTTKIKDTIERMEPYQYVKNQTQAKLKREQEAERRKGATAPLAEGAQQSQVGLLIGGDRADRKEMLKATVNLDWTNINEELVYNKKNQDFFFVADNICKEHNVLLVNHHNPHLCDAVKYSTAYALSCCESIDLVAGLTSGAGMKYIRHTNRASCVTGNHIWYIDTVRRVDVKGQFFEIPVGERCGECFATQEVTHFPKWLESIMRHEEFIYVNG